MRKDEFTKEEIEQLEKLIRLRVTTDRNSQKRIRANMRDIGFYGSNYGITDMTIDKFHTLIEQGQIKVVNNTTVKKQITPKVISVAKPNKAVESYCTSMKPIVFPDSEILILGTMPGKASLEIQEYYASPNNCFWRIIEAIYNNGIRLNNYNEKLSCLKRNKIALWDVYESCIRDGSLDSDINNTKLNDIKGLLSKYKKIRKVIFNGQKAALEFIPDVSYQIICSTSNSNTYYTREEKIMIWKNAINS